MFAIVIIYIATLCNLILSVYSSTIPINQLVVVEPSSYVVVRLRGYDQEYSTLKANIKSLPSSGSIYQLSQVYNKYGYEPKAGTQISSTDTNITGSNNRFVYKRPIRDVLSNSAWDRIYFTIYNPISESHNGSITFVPPSGAIVGSNFMFSNEDWTITGNKAIQDSTFEPKNIGSQLSFYIYGTDNEIYLKNGVDSTLWYFEAPVKFLTNLGISYGGTLSFTLSAFSGNFNELNGNSLHVVELICDDCIGPVYQGITLAWPINAENFKSFTGSTQTFTFSLLETVGWVKDPQNSLLSWTKPSQCDMIQVLSRISKIRILGDWTTWYETVALDNVLIANTEGKQPICSMSISDASICTC